MDPPLLKEEEFKFLLLFASEVRLEFMPSGIPAVADPFQVTQG